MQEGVLNTEKELKALIEKAMLQEIKVNDHDMKIGLILN